MISCVKCQSASKLMCSRCFDPYCGVSCQRNDWLEHKLVCKPMPSLRTIDTHILESAPKTNEVEISCNREICEASSSIIGPKRDGRTSASRIQNDISTNALFNNLLFENDKKSESKSEPVKTNLVQHKSPPPQQQPKKSVDNTLSEMIAVKPGLTLSPKNRFDSIPNEPNSAETPRSVKLGLSHTLSSTESCPLEAESVQKSHQKRYFLKDLNVVPIREGKNVPLFVTDTSLLDKFFLCALDLKNKESLKLKTNMRKVAQYCKMTAKTNNSGYKPEENELCLAIFDEDGEWYRAVVIEQKPCGYIYNVQFFDYGNMAEVSSTKILPIPEELMFPTCTNLCALKYTEKSSLAKLKEMIDANAVIEGDVNHNKQMDVFEVAFSNV